MKIIEVENVMKIIDKNNIPSYDIVSIEHIEELKIEGYLLKHKKTGANLVAMVTEDENKVFNIGFKTPPYDNTGLPHILEHSVLCGSKKYPPKDPFVELVKGSLNTFLNAMTYPDKTIYPVASCNDKDFSNLMDVYMDAVFNPNIYDKKEIFMQEGFHYHIERPEDKLTYNGVVYNEMKGAFSTPESVLGRMTTHELFPDTCYANESGGDPDEIPQLTYEKFIEFHKKYYHPSNCFIMLYGDMDMEEKLNYIDSEYLSKYEYLEVDSHIEYQEPFKSIKEVEKKYPIGSDEDTKDKVFLNYAVATDTSLDEELYYAMKVMDYALISMPGSPIKKALIEKGIGKDVNGGYSTGYRQNQFIINAKNTEKEKKEDFILTIENTIKNIIKTGFDKDSLRAGINVMEFQYREADFGSYPKGLFYCLDMLDSWLYDENRPFILIKAGEIFEKLKKLVETDYFEKLAEKYFINNNHKVLCVLVPEKGMTEEKNKSLEKELENHKNDLSEEEINQLVKITNDLIEYQNTPSTKEELETIPVIKLTDIETEPKDYDIEEKNEEGIKIIHSNINTNGICYLKVSFDGSKVPEEMIPYLGLLDSVLGYMDTENYKYDDLNNMINTHSGGASTNVGMYVKRSGEEVLLNFEGSVKVFNSEMKYGFKILNEILLKTIVDNEKRLNEIISENMTRYRMKITSQGHVTAMYRAQSYISEGGILNDILNGIGAYEFYNELLKDYDSIKTDIISKLKELIKILFTKENLIISVTTDDKGYDLMKKEMYILTNDLFSDSAMEKREKLKCTIKNEGFKTTSPVSYVARTGDFKKFGHKYSGALEALRNILDYEYLWVKVRINGGAYGVMTSWLKNSGLGSMISYRDPNVLKTNEVFESVPEYLRSFDADDRDMLKFIIGTISTLDTPLTPRTQGSRSFSAYMCGNTYEELAKTRSEILDLKVEDIRNMASAVEDIIKQGCICVVGNSEKIEEDKALFKEVKNLFS